MEFAPPQSSTNPTPCRDKCPIKLRFTGGMSVWERVEFGIKGLGPLVEGLGFNDPQNGTPNFGKTPNAEVSPPFKDIQARPLGFRI